MQLAGKPAADRVGLAGKRDDGPHVDAGELRVDDEDGFRRARVDVDFSIDAAVEHAKAKRLHLNGIRRSVDGGLQIVELPAASTPFRSRHIKRQVERFDSTLRTLRTLCTLWSREQRDHPVEIERLSGDR